MFTPAFEISKKKKALVAFLNQTQTSLGRRAGIQPLGFLTYPLIQGVSPPQLPVFHGNKTKISTNADNRH